MSYDVRHYRLPEEASAADRVTLLVWKAWTTWFRPLLLATVVMTFVSIVVGTFIAKSGGYVGKWSPTNYAPSVPIGGLSLVQMSGAEWTRGILAQFASVAAAAVAVWFVLRRTPRPAAVGAISGLAVVVMHLTFSHQWSLQPIVAAPSGYQAAALVSLWMLPIVTAGMGIFLGRRRALGNRVRTAQ